MHVIKLNGYNATTENCEKLDAAYDVSSENAATNEKIENDD